MHMMECEGGFDFPLTLCIFSSIFIVISIKFSKLEVSETRNSFWKYFLPFSLRKLNLEIFLQNIFYSFNTLSLKFFYKDVFISVTFLVKILDIRPNEVIIKLNFVTFMQYFVFFWV